MFTGGTKRTTNTEVCRLWHYLVHMTIISRYTSLLIPICLFLAGCKDIPDVPVQEYRIICNPDSLKFVFDNAKKDNYVPVQVTFAGKTHNGRMRVRGDTSRGFPKKSLKIQIQDENGNETETINLNAEYLDKSYVHQHLSSIIIRESGLPCFQTGFAPVFMNEVFYGLYVEVENMDEKFLKMNGMNPKGNLYKASRDGASISVFDKLEKHWEKKTNKEDSWYDIDALIHEVDTVSSSGLQTYLKTRFHYNDLVSHVALNVYLCNGSTYYHNYYLYRNHEVDEKWKFLHWDLDKSLSHYDWRNSYELGNGSDADNALIAKLYCDSIFMVDVSTELNRVDGIVQKMNLGRYIDKVYKVLSPWIEQDKTDEVDDLVDWKARLDKEKTFLKSNLLKRLEVLNGPLQPFHVDAGPHTPVLFPVISWSLGKNANLHDISYEVKYSFDRNMPDSATTSVKDIKDTCFTIVQSLPEGELYYKVVAHHKDQTLTGYNRLSRMQVIHVAKIISEINHNLLLQAKEGPFLIDRDIVIPEGVSLTVEKGCDIFLVNGCSVLIKGKLQVNSSSTSPVRFMCAQSAGGWKLLELDNCSDVNFNACIFSEGRIAYHNTNLRFENCEFILKNLNLDKEEGRPSIIWGEGGTLVMNHCLFNGNGTGEGMNIHRGYPVVQNCVFDHVPDAIEYISADSGLIIGNLVRFSKDDAIDLNDCRNVKIESNVLYRNRDKAISIGVDHSGSSKNIQVSNNYICRNGTGVEVKDSSEAIISGNILFENQTNIGLRIKEQGYKKGGKAEVIGNILLAFSEESNILKDKESILELGSNRCNVPIEGVIAIDSALFYSFAESPFFVSHEAAVGNLLSASDVIIMEEDSGFFRLTNRFNAPIDMGGIQLMNRDRICLTIPTNCILDPGETLFLFNSKKLPKDNIPLSAKYFHYRKVEKGMNYQLHDSQGKWILSIPNYGS